MYLDMRLSRSIKIIIKIIIKWGGGAMCRDKKLVDRLYFENRIT